MAKLPEKLPSSVVEEIVLLTSVLKWLLLSILTGLLVGLSATAFLFALERSIQYTSQFGFYFLLLPIGMFLSALIVKYIAPEAVGHGTEKVIEAVHKKAGKISFPVIPVKFIATIVTLSTGGSVGKEGPCAQIGGGVASLLADCLRFSDYDRRKLVICGISAGFSTVFGTPIAGAIFGIEVLYVGNIFYDALFPSFVSGMVAFQVAHFLGLTYYHHPISFAPLFSQSFIIEVALAGLFFGGVSFLFVETMEFFNEVNKKLNLWRPFKAFLGGSGLVILALLFGRDFLGLGLPVIKNALDGAKIVWYFFFLKMLFTSITLAFGGSGGIVTPLFFVGAASGSLFAAITGADRATFAAIGMVSVLAGAANTPISASIMAVELFGAKIGPYAAIICIISYLLTGHRSVYPSQVIVRTKSPSVYVEPGRVIEDLESVEVKPRKGTLFDLMLKCIEGAMAFLTKSYEYIKKKKEKDKD